MADLTLIMYQAVIEVKNTIAATEPIVINIEYLNAEKNCVFLYLLDNFQI